MEALDRRYLAKQRADGVMFPKKDRIEGSPSKSLPPPGAPGWALDKSRLRHANLESGELATIHVMSTSACTLFRF